MKGQFWTIQDWINGEVLALTESDNCSDNLDRLVLYSKPDSFLIIVGENGYNFIAAVGVKPKKWFHRNYEEMPYVRITDLVRQIPKITVKEFSESDIVVYNGMISRWGIMRYLNLDKNLHGFRKANIHEINNYYKHGL